MTYDQIVMTVLDPAIYAVPQPRRPRMSTKRRSADGQIESAHDDRTSGYDDFATWPAETRWSAQNASVLDWLAGLGEAGMENGVDDLLGIDAFVEEPQAGW